MGFVWLVAKGELHTMENLQFRRPYKTLNSLWCILCCENEEDNDHLFLHCKIARELKQKLFKIMVEEWRIQDFLSINIVVWDRVISEKDVDDLFL